MSWVAVAIGGSAVIGGVLGSNAAGDAADAQEHASDASIAEQRRQYDINRADQRPWMNAGRGAVNRLSAYSGGDTSQFLKSPDYAFRRSEGQRDIGNSFAARGGAFGGNALRALTQFNQNLAGGELNNWWNRQAGLAGVGQAATSQVGAFGANAANNIGNSLMQQGDARASGIINQSNAFSGTLGDLAGTYGYFKRNRGGGWNGGG